MLSRSEGTLMDSRDEAERLLAQNERQENVQFRLWLPPYQVI